MTYSYYLLLLLLLLSGEVNMACLGNNKDKKEPELEAHLIVDAKLLDVGLPAPKPGVVYTVSLMHYEILTVIHGEYSHQYIFVGHHVPNLAGSEFRIGTCHRLQLTKEFPEHASILDKFQNSLSGSQRFFCLSFEVIGSCLKDD